MSAGRIIPIILAVAWGIFILVMFSSCVSAFSNSGH